MLRVKNEREVALQPRVLSRDDIVGLIEMVEDGPD